MGERESARALERMDEEIQRVARVLFDEGGGGGGGGHGGGATEPAPLPRSLFDVFVSASFEIMDVFFYPKFLRSAAYRRLLREIRKSSIIQERIERAHFL